MSYSNVLPSWTVGTDSYDNVYNVVKPFGKKAVVVGGETAMKCAYGTLKKALSGYDFELSEPICYGKNSTYENVERLAALEEVKNADMVFGMGGGRAIDTSKAVAETVNLPLFTFPTIASNCAPVTAIGVIYNSDNSLNGYYYPKECPKHTFINTKIIANAPSELFWAGIGDALSKGPEVELATRGKILEHTPFMGAELAQACTNPLVEFGAKAMEQVRANKTGYEMEQVVLDIIITTGLVSNMTTDETKYYYNSSLAHCVYNGSTKVSASGGNHLHGEIVSFGVLTLLTYDEQLEERDRIMKFNRSIGLPVTLEEINLREEDLQTVTDVAKTVREWTKAPYTVTEEKFKQAMRDASKAGKKLIAEELN